MMGTNERRDDGAGMPAAVPWAAAFWAIVGLAAFAIWG